ncbi:Aldehyde/histidinol dehydrogenase [Gymnopilus junonius]|uniref:Aldehyde/histidinol dehydrogenase n=1 Tax=Gymnopilus junonius TaxID=109634 RepID=A0A9P5TF70_GYMJU|nr:Aldehyde/histidinol dehydrogenase [Gymnopilus junonius]
MSPPLTQLYINGQWVPSSTGDTFKVHNPYSGDVVGLSSSASSDDCKTAIKAASEAFKTWRHTPLTLRRDIFLKAAEIIQSEKYKNKIMQSVAEETAAAAYWGVYNSMHPVNFLRTQAGSLSLLNGEMYPSGNVPGAQVITRRRPMGVVFAIAPWNAPVALSLRAIAVPILCGNAVILKSSEFSPRSQSVVAELFEEAGLPAGVLNFLSMSPKTTPSLTAEIIANPFVKCINFTGSDRVGKIIATEAAKHLKPCVLELGGKSPVIVLNDANVEEAARVIVSSSMSHSGQICMASTRVIAQSGVTDKLISQVKEIAGSLRAGDVQNDKGVSLGALFTEASANNAISAVKDALENGAELILGDVSNRKAVVQPHLLKNVKPGTRLWDKETFAPVLSFAVVDTIDEAVDLANASEYSLSAALWSNDIWSAQDIATRINSGYTNINGPTVHSEASDGLIGLGGPSGYGRFHLESFTHKCVTVIHPLGRKLPLVG